MLKDDALILKTGNWEPQNKKRLEKLIREKAFNGNYAVFDWDFTSIFYDTQDNLFVYQIENLKFNLTPEEFDQTIRAGIPQDVILPHTANLEGKALTAGELSDDLNERYDFLYKNYSGFGGIMSLAEITLTEEFIDFKAKMLVLMRGAASLCGVDIGQSVSTGMTIEELSGLTETAIDQGLKDEIKTYTVKSSSVLKGRAGEVEGGYRKGLRIQEEMQNLFSALRENGIEVYICSASQEDNVRVFASYPKYGYNLDAENVFGRRRLFDENKKLTVMDDTSIPATRREGKAEAIKKLIAPKHQNKAPVLIAGDGDGDFFMMDAFKNEALILIFNRSPKKEAKIFPLLMRGIKEREKSETGIIVQHRDNGKGRFISKAPEEERPLDSLPEK
ncbi:haloacid dehalogenase-like hydrolase [Treponema sp. OMZ 788]|uniref:haloacid dehalogenase-like hydrolase n=1 Tax=Treponema sp. OMZ 788 TaxID=2563664 RepID=UPI0020A51C0C|nr:haloacid dehalogenase-like hydrolase [Treponema sp. OMZ 788]UTC65331.1 haloacid dehalogenase-like hydrolase [Treponema sp. OMZ 788]